MQDADVYRSKGSKKMCGMAMEHRYQRTAALSDDEEDESESQAAFSREACAGDSDSTWDALRLAGAAGAASGGGGNVCSAPARSSKFTYANKQQKDMRRKAKEWFSST